MYCIRPSRPASAIASPAFSTSETSFCRSRSARTRSDRSVTSETNPRTVPSAATSGTYETLTVRSPPSACGTRSS
jgi:hypothetical protein